MKRIYIVITVLAMVSAAGRISAQDYLVTDVSAFRLQSKFVGGVDFRFAPSRTAENSLLTPGTFNIKAGYSFKHIYIMGNLGIEYMNEENFIPLGVELRYNFSTNDRTLFAYGKGGYSFHLKRNIHSRYFTANYAQYDPSLFLETGIGYAFASTLSEFYLSIGYLYHELVEEIVEQSGEVRTDLSMHGLSLTLGFVF